MWQKAITLCAMHAFNTRVGLPEGLHNTTVKPSHEVIDDLMGWHHGSTLVSPFAFRYHNILYQTRLFRCSAKHQHHGAKMQTRQQPWHHHAVLTPGPHCYCVMMCEWWYSYRWRDVIARASVHLNDQIKCQRTIVLSWFNLLKGSPDSLSMHLLPYYTNTALFGCC